MLRLSMLDFASWNLHPMNTTIWRALRSFPVPENLVLNIIFELENLDMNWSANRFHAYLTLTFSPSPC